MEGHFCFLWCRHPRPTHTPLAPCGMRMESASLGRREVMVITGGESKDPALRICFVQRPPRKPSPSLLPWVGGLVPCAWMVGGTGGFKKTGCVVVVKGMTTMTPSDFLFLSLPFQKILNFDFFEKHLFFVVW